MSASSSSSARSRRSSASLLRTIQRWIRYRLIVPVFRSPHSAAHTARGVANGVFWGLTPTVGLQTIEILATWLLLKRVLRKDSSLVQAMVWVWVNNPLTVVPMYYAFYVTGLWLTGRRGLAVDYSSFTISGLSITNVGVPLLLGCVPYAVTGAVLSYFWATRVVRRRQQRLADRRREQENYGTFRT
jgi:uncharacterized protein (DUF2062 family)